MLERDRFENFLAAFNDFRRYIQARSDGHNLGQMSHMLIDIEF
jgi:hypothetical protein